MGAIDVNGIACRIPGGTELFAGVTFRVGNGEHVALVGANGAGKTTLFGAIAGDAMVSDGSIHVDGRLLVMSPPRPTTTRSCAGSRSRRRRSARSSGPSSR